jgi:MFS family permease
LAPQHRARNFGIYTVSLVIGWALGNWVGLAMVADTPRAAFLIGGAASLISAMLVQTYLPPIEARSESNQPAVSLNLRDNLLSFGSAWCQGFLEGGFMTFLMLYLLGLGLTEQHTGWLISMSMIGMIALQIPVTWLGDYFGRQLVLLICYGLVVIGLIVLPLSGTSMLLPISLFLVAACAGAFYPLGLALLGENLPAGQLDRGNAWYLSVEGVGCLMGPALMGIACDYGGEGAMFVVSVAAILLTLNIWLLGRRPDAAPAVFAVPIDTMRKAA